MGPQFHETGYGRRFFDHQLPALTNAIEKLTEATEKLVETNDVTNNPSAIAYVRPFPERDEEITTKLFDIMNNSEKAKNFAASFFEAIHTDQEELNDIGYHMARAILNNNLEEFLVAVSGWSSKSLLDITENDTLILSMPKE